MLVANRLAAIGSGPEYWLAAWKRQPQDELENRR